MSRDGLKEAGLQLASHDTAMQLVVLHTRIILAL